MKQKQTEDELHQATAELERLVAQRTCELQQANEELQTTLEKLQVAQEELRQQNEELARSRELIELERQRYQDLFELAPNGYLVTDNWGNIQQTNRAAATLFSVQQQRLIGKPLLVFIAKPERQNFHTRLAQLQQVQNWEVSLLPRSGVPFPAMLAATSIHDENGQQVGWRWLLRDISDRKQMEQRLQAAHDELERLVEEGTDQLRRRERQFSTLVENSPDVIFRLDCNLRHIYISPKVAYESGIPIQQFLGKTGRELGLPFDACDLFEAACHEALTTRQVTQVEYSIAGKHYVSRLIPEQATDGTVESLMGITQNISDRKQAEEALHKKEEQLRLALDTTNTGSWDWNLLTGELTWNDNHFRLLGLFPGEVELNYRTWRDRVHPEDIDRVEQLVNYALENNTDYEAEYRFIHSDGSVHWVIARGRGIYNESGQAVRMVGIMFDITKRKQTEEALHKIATENLRLAQAVTSAAEGIFITDPNQPGDPIIYINPAFSRITGYQPQEVIGHNTRFLQGSGTDRQTVAEIRQALAQQREVTATILDYRKDGQPFWNELKISPVFSDEGNLLYFVGIQTDVTERKQAEEKIREQAALLDVATDAIFVRDLEYRILYWNSGAERLYGWQAAEVLGRNCHEFLCKQISSQMEEALRTVVEQGEWQGEENKITKSGQEIIVCSRWTLVRDEAGQPKSILSVDTDITEKKELQTQFLRVQRLESIGTLASGIAHDLNNVLTPILLLTQMLKVESRDERRKQYLEIIETNARRGAGLIKQVLSFARNADRKHVPLQIGHILREIEQVVKQTFPKLIEVTNNISTRELSTVSGDVTQLHQVFMNLCINARDAMPNGGTLRITAENLFIDSTYARMNIEAKVGAYVVVTVSDTGVGITPEIIDRIFDPFFTTKEVSKGTGLGLSTALGIVKNHGGFITVSSGARDGSQFKVFLPAITDTTATQQEEDKIKLPEGKGELILVVDDEAVIRNVAQTILLSSAFRVLVASDGIEAISLYAQHKHEIRVVIMDLIMPSMDGLTAIRTLKVLNPQVQIIAMSGLGSQEAIAQAMQLGIQTFLPKPFTTEQFANTLQQVGARG